MLSKIIWYLDNFWKKHFYEIIAINSEEKMHLFEYNDLNDEEFNPESNVNKIQNKFGSN